VGQVNVNPPGQGGSGDSAAAAGINLITVLVVAIVLVAVLWFLFTGPLQNAFSGSRQIDVNVNTPAQQAPAPAQPPAQPQAPSKP
jgi:hypothetical protein